MDPTLLLRRVFVFNNRLNRVGVITQYSTKLSRVGHVGGNNPYLTSIGDGHAVL